MIELHYKPLCDNTEQTILYLLTDIMTEKSDKAIFVINGARQGYIKINSQKFKIKNGSAEVDLSLIPDGLIEPRIIIGTKSIFAMPFLKEGNYINKIPIGDEVYRIIDKTFTEFFTRISSAEAKIIRIEEKLHPLNLFNF